MEKPLIAKHVFKVTSKEEITPHYIRIKLKADEPTEFHQCSPGANNKIFIPPAGTSKVQFASYDDKQGAWVMPDESIKPLVRTYTHRGMDKDSQEITIDFVNHGENGPASAWASRAKPQDELGVAMKIRETVLYPEADWYFLIADSTAIPVLCCILESLPPAAIGHCLIEVHSKADIHPEVKHDGFEIQWVFNEHPEQGSSLAQLAKEVPLPEGRKVFSYVACEYQSVREIRSYFKEYLNWNKEDFYAFSYWKAGVAEDQSALERREEKK